MKRMQKSFFAIAAFLSVANMVADSGRNSCTTSSTYFSIRPQGVNAVRDMVGWENLINLCDVDKFYGAFAITAEYGQSFKGNRLARCLFGPDLVSSPTTSSTTCNRSCDTDSDDCNNNVLTISGSTAANRGANDWLADYFGLPSDFKSTISFRPKIKTFVADLSFYLGLDDWACGMYFRVGLPIVHTKWDLRFCEEVVTAGTCATPAGYYGNEAVPFANLLTRATDFLSGNAVPTLPAGSDVTFDTLNCSKFASNSGTGRNNCTCKGLRKTRLADVLLVLGWNFVCCDDYFFGLNIRTLAPTGNKPCGEFLFEPVVGNGGHWELGAGLSSRAVLWRGCDSDSTFSVYLDANITHLFKACQRRSFDLCGKPNSRYMLAERMGPNTQGLAGSPTAGVTTGTTASAVQFARELAPVANLTCAQVRVSYAVQGDVALKFEYANGCGFTWDLGYEFWGRSHEKICFNDTCRPAALNGSTWALKGDAMVIGFANTSDEAPVALAATQSRATIHGGTNGWVPGCQGDAAPSGNATAIANPGIDNPQFAVSTTLDAVIFTQPGGDVQTHTSIPPVFLSTTDLDLSGTKGISNKVFTHFSYAWTGCEDWTPFLGVGASAEFGSGCGRCSTSCNTTTTNTTTTTNCSSACGDSGSCDSKRCAVSQWAVWVKGGIAFN